MVSPHEPRLCFRCLKVTLPKRRYDGKNAIWRLGCSHCGSFVFFNNPGNNNVQ